MAKKKLDGSTSSKTDAGLVTVLFLTVVDIIIKKNRIAGVTPDSERSLSRLIGPDPTSIAKIRRGERNLKLQQITNLGNHFNLDFNNFFRALPVSYELHNERIFLQDNKQALTTRMEERLMEEVTRIQNVILTYREELEKLQKEKGDSDAVSQSKNILQEASEKIKEAFSKK